MAVRLTLLLAATLLATVSFSEANNRRPFRSIRAPKETVFEYEVVQPVVTYRDSKQAHPRKLHVRVPTRETNYSLILELNEVILSSGFTSRHYDDQGKEVVTKGHVNCFYQGRVEGHPDWRVTISTCHGLQGSFGDSNDEKNYYHIEPVNIQDGSIEQFHAFFLDTEYKDKHGDCGSNHSHVPDDLILRPNMDTLHHSNHRRLRRQSSSTLYVEMVVINDNRQYVSQSSNLSATVLRALEIANGMDNLYNSALNIRIILVEAITWSNGDQFTVSSASNTLLNTLNSQQGNVIPSSTTYDTAMLLTGIDLVGSTVGIAFVGAMCGSSSVGLTQDGGRSLSSVISTAAHELGHVFNMNHDDTNRACTCADGNQGCIMAAILSNTPPTRWSSCSLSDLNDGFTDRNTDRCLSNVPTTSVGDPVCGNGIREGDEICDCGSAQECTDPCCNAATCQLASGAQCSAGPCCTSTCQFVSYGTECRAALGGCDIAEYCLGDSSECPSDEHQRNGISCSSNAGYCNAGMCPTHNAQCQRAFGSNKGANTCYTSLNTRGDQFGNCGHSTTSFLSCSTSNVQCGQLHCMSGNFLLSNLGVSVTTLTFTIGSQICRSFTSAPSTNMDIESPGLVEDGTRCGDGLVCQSQQCVSVTTTPQCSTGSNGQVCSGNGVCNNQGTCSCNVGYTGSTCETTFNGPGGEINECNTNNGGCDQICTDTTSSFTCSCNSGYTLSSNGRTCLDINECTANTDGCSQGCTNTAGSFTCTCFSGFTLNSNGITCSDINECTANTDGCSQGCTNTAGSFICTCNSGFTLASNGRTCLDINECTANTDGCSQGCTNTAGSFICTCNSGFTLASDGRTCLDINECTTNTDGCTQGCTNTAGSFTCTCNSGFTLASDGRTCVEDNECTDGTHNCEQVCINTQGGFTCECLSGYQLNSDQATCTDINECSSNSGGCQQFCTNNAGSFACSCRIGYSLGSDGLSCNDINECSTNNGGCASSCSNTVGSFECSCSDGFQLATDGLACNDINECNVNNGGCNQMCTNTAGSFGCSCQTGFTLSQDGLTCTAINACEEGSNNCAQLCSTGSGGTFTCSCETGYTLNANGFSCDDINECASNGGGCSATCENTAGSFTCSCLDGFQLGGDRLTCVDINECLQVENNNCEQTCTNTQGSYDCECQSGFTLNDDGFSCNAGNNTSVAGPSDGDSQQPGSTSALIGGIAGGVVGGIVFVVVVIIVIVVVVIMAMKSKDSKRFDGSSSYSSHYGNGLHHTPSTAHMLKNEVSVNMDDSNGHYNYTSSSSTFTPPTPMSPAVVYTPPPPHYADSYNNFSPKPAPVPLRAAPQRPPTRKAPPAPKPHTSSSANVQNEGGQQSTAAAHKPTPMVLPTKQNNPQKRPPLIPSGTPPAIQLKPAPFALPKKEKPIKPDPQLRPAPMAPPKAEKPSAPPRHNVPPKPTPSSKPFPSPKPAPVSAPKPAPVLAPKPAPVMAPKPVHNEGAAIPTPKPKPKPKPVVPVEKPVVNRDRVVPPKPAVKPAGLDNGPNKPKPAPKPSVAPHPTPAPKPQLPASNGAPESAKKPLVPPTKKPILPPPRH